MAVIFKNDFLFLLIQLKILLTNMLVFLTSTFFFSPKEALLSLYLLMLLIFLDFLGITQKMGAV